MRDYLAALFLVIGFWWSPAWLIAWVIGRKCHYCELRRKCEAHKPGAEILHHPGSRGFR